jgi:hypothetical protein
VELTSNGGAKVAVTAGLLVGVGDSGGGGGHPKSQLLATTFILKFPKFTMAGPPQ